MGTEYEPPNRKIIPFPTTETITVSVDPRIIEEVKQRLADYTNNEVENLSLDSQPAERKDVYRHLQLYHPITPPDFLPLFSAMGTLYKKLFKEKP